MLPPKDSPPGGPGHVVHRSPGKRARGREQDAARVDETGAVRYTIVVQKQNPESIAPFNGDHGNGRVSLPG